MIEKRRGKDDGERRKVYPRRLKGISQCPHCDSLVPRGGAREFSSVLGSGIVELLRRRRQEQPKLMLNSLRSRRSASILFLPQFKKIIATLMSLWHSKQNDRIPQQPSAAQLHEFQDDTFHLTVSGERAPLGIHRAALPADIPSSSPITSNRCKH